MTDYTTVDVDERCGTDDNVFVHVVEFPDGASAWSPVGRRDYAQIDLIGRNADASTHNVTCTAMHEAAADGLNPLADTSARPAELAFGDDWGGGASPDPAVFDSTDTALNNEVGRISLTDPSSAGAVFTVSEFVDTLELNGYTLREVGIVDSNDDLWNHAPIDPEIPKTNSVGLAVTIDVPVTAAP